MAENTENTDDQAERVNDGADCPGCGENRMDELAWAESGAYVRCSSCGKTYVPA